MFCSKCGNEINNDAIFCNKCGAKIRIEENSNEYVIKQKNRNIPNMKNIKKAVGVIGGIIAFIIVAFFGINFVIGMKNPGRFIKDSDSNMQYKFKDGHFAENEWVFHNNNYYYFSKSGIMQKNKWVDNDYYVGSDGIMKKSCFIEDLGNKYYLKDDGKYANNELIDISGKTYAFKDDGTNIKNSIFKNASPSYICYVNNDGYVEKGNGLTNVSGGSVYIVNDKTGELKTNDWIKNEKTGKYAFFDENGWLVKNKKIIGFEVDGKKHYATETSSNSFEEILAMYYIGSVVDMKYYYVDENGDMLSNDSKTIDGIEWQFDNEGIGRKLNWKSSIYTNSYKKYVINKYYFEGQYLSSLYDKGKIAKLEICVDNDDITFFIYEGENKRKVKNTLTYTDDKYSCTITSKSIPNKYRFNGTMYGKGDRVFVDDDSARVAIKNLLIAGENFIIRIYENDSYWDENYCFLVDAGNFAEIYNSTLKK